MSDTDALTPLRRWRLAAGLSIRDLSRLTGINRGRLSIIERGVPPTVAEMDSISRELQQASRERVA